MDCLGDIDRRWLRHCFDEGTRAKDLDAAPRIEGEQVAVSRQEEMSLAVESQGEKLVVLGVPTFGDDGLHGDDLNRFAEVE